MMYTFQAIQIIIFLIPGFIADIVYNGLVVRRQPKEFKLIIEALIFSVLIYTRILYEEDIIDWFESNYIPAFSSLQNNVYYYIAPGDEFANYVLLTLEGVDDNSNPIEATVRVDLLPQ